MSSILLGFWMFAIVSTRVLIMGFCGIAGNCVNMYLACACYSQASSQAELDRWNLKRVSDRFRVIALGLPVPRYKGNPLDPPLRSRFQGHDVQGLRHQVTCMLHFRRSIIFTLWQLSAQFTITLCLHSDSTLRYAVMLRLII